MRAPLLIALMMLSRLLHADPLTETRIRPQLPPEARTVGAAIAFYAEAAGYQFLPRTVAAGDARRLAYAPVRPIPATAPIVSVQDAILAVLPEPARLAVDVQHRAVAIALEPTP